MELEKVRFFVHQKNSGLISEVNFASCKGDIFFAVPYGKKTNII